MHDNPRTDGHYIKIGELRISCGIGAIEIPDTFALPDVTVKTRKGVALTYEPSPAAQLRCEQTPAAQISA